MLANVVDVPFNSLHIVFRVIMKINIFGPKCMMSRLSFDVDAVMMCSHLNATQFSMSNLAKKQAVYTVYYGYGVP